jgi:hypothetical protein
MAPFSQELEPPRIPGRFKEYRLLLLCLARIDPRLSLEEQRIFRVHAGDMDSYYGVERARAYLVLQEVAERLFERKVELRDPQSAKIREQLR